MSAGTQSEAEAELAIERLLLHLDAWLLQQPEMMLLWAQPRHVRRQVSKLLAEHIATIPKREGAAEPGRAVRRQILQAIRAAGAEWFKGVKL